MSDAPNSSPSPETQPPPAPGLKDLGGTGGDPPSLIKQLIWFWMNPKWLAGSLGIIIISYIIVRLTGHDCFSLLPQAWGIKTFENYTNMVSVVQTNQLFVTNSFAIGLTNQIWATNDVLENVDLNDPKTIECINYARAHGKPYWIESLTMIIHSHMDPTNDLRTDTFQIVYVLRLLRDVTREDHSFAEEFDTGDQRGRFTRISGSEREITRDNNEKFYVEVSGRAGEVRTVVTSGRFSWPYDSQPHIVRTLNLGKFESVWDYGNDDDDAIRELTMFLYSEGEPISPVGEAAIRLTRDGFIDPAECRHEIPDQSNGPIISSLSAHWENVFGGEAVGLHYSWPPFPP